MILRPRFWLVLAAPLPSLAYPLAGHHSQNPTTTTNIPPFPPPFQKKKFQKSPSSPNYPPHHITVLSLPPPGYIQLTTFRRSLLWDFQSSVQKRNITKRTLLCSSALLLQNESDLHTPSCSHSPVMYCIDVSRVQQTSSMSRSIRRGVRC